MTLCIGVKVLTHGSDNLRLQTELALEAAGKVGDATAAIASNIGHVADVVEHVAAGEEQDGNHGAGGPEIAVLDDGQQVGAGGGDQGANAEQQGDASRPADVVDGSLDLWVRTAGEVADNPVVHLLSGGRSVDGHVSKACAV